MPNCEWHEESVPAVYEVRYAGGEGFACESCAHDLAIPYPILAPGEAAPENTPRFRHLAPQGWFVFAITEKEKNPTSRKVRKVEEP